MNKIIEEIAQRANSILNASKVEVKLPDGYKIVEDKINSTGRIFVAVKDNTLIEFLTDGQLNEKDSLDFHIDTIIKDIKKSVENSHLYDGYSNFISKYMEYKTKNNIYKIYVQDVLVNNEMYSRMFNAYFVEPTTKEFCQITVARGQYNIKERKLLKDMDNKQTDEINISLAKLLTEILDRIIYHNE